MKLTHKLQLAYCTNVHRGETWAETFDSLRRSVLRVKERICPRDPFAIGLRLSARAAATLSEKSELTAFRRWMDRTGCYVFTLNGFPYGRFHGGPVKSAVFAPDWTTTQRLEYTKTLISLLAAILPDGMEGSISTVPVSFKGWVLDDGIQRSIENLESATLHAGQVFELHEKKVRIGMEPEPWGLIETTPEAVAFFETLRSRARFPMLVNEYLGITYDACHMAIEYEDVSASLTQLTEAKIPVVKIHLTSAPVLTPTPHALEALSHFQDPVYLHQVIIRDSAFGLRRFQDLPCALRWAKDNQESVGEEWRVHFHIPLHCPERSWFRPSSKESLEILNLLRFRPQTCSHLEMETYTWEVLPEKLRAASVEEQIASEYAWCLERLDERNFGRAEMRKHKGMAGHHARG